MLISEAAKRISKIVQRVFSRSCYSGVYGYGGDHRGSHFHDVGQLYRVSMLLIFNQMVKC